MISENSKINGFSANALKYYAIIAMVIDHIAWAFVPTQSALGYIMHIIGRATAPIMCFFIVEGFHYTKDVKKYLLRMMLFSVLSWLPYYWFQHDSIPSIKSFSFLFGTQSVIFTFCLALLVLITVHTDKLRPFFKILVILVAIYLSCNGDWGYIIIFWALIFDRYRGDYKKIVIFFSIASFLLITIYVGDIYNNYIRLLFTFPDLIKSFPIYIIRMISRIWYQYAVVLALIPLYFYNGKRGKSSDNKIIKFINKWFFYVFYPIHLLIICLLRSI